METAVQEIEYEVGYWNYVLGRKYWMAYNLFPERKTAEQMVKGLNNLKPATADREWIVREINVFAHLPR